MYDADDGVLLKVTSDVTVLKRLQDLQNETLIVIEEIIMSNAMELVSHNKYTVAVRQDIARLQAELADQRQHQYQLSDDLQRHLANTPHNKHRAIGITAQQPSCISAASLTSCVSVCPRYRRKTTRAINIKLGRG